MAGKNRRDVLAMLGGASPAGVVVVGQASDSYTSSRKKTQERHFPNFELTTHEGKKVRFYDDLVKDKIVVINFFYADCVGICPGITANLKRVQELLGDRVGRDIFMYSITLRPEKDKTAALDHYVKMHKIKPGWTFLTGKPDEIDTLRRKLGFSDNNPELDKDRNNHIGMVRYGNEPRQWWAMCPGRAKPKWIVESIGWMDGPKRRTPEAEAKS
jgi:protein SCO1